jgi:hypothetical protein
MWAQIILSVCKGEGAIENVCRTFPIYLSFCRSKSKLSFDFIFECMKDFMFIGVEALQQTLCDYSEAESTRNIIRAN